MNTSYIIRLPVKPGEPVLHFDGASGDLGELGSVDELAVLSEKIGGRAVVVLVPGELVTIHSLDISGRLTPAVLQSIPYRLEDDLATDVDNLHVAVLEKDSGRVTVAVLENQWMECWQGWLEDAGIHASHWLPDTLALPWRHEKNTAVRIGDTCLLRTGMWNAAVCDIAWLDLYLEASLAGVENEQQKPFICYGEPCAQLPGQWEYQPFNALLQTMEIDSSINLLQGRWQPKAPWKKHLKPFRLSGALLALVAVGWLASAEYETRQLQQQADSYQAEARNIYQRLFPGERVVRLQSQLNQKIAMLEQPVDNETGLLVLLEELAPVFLQNSGLKTQSVQFDLSRNSLRLEATAPEFETFSQFREQAGKLVDVNVESLEQKGELVEGIMQIRSRAS